MISFDDFKIDNSAPIYLQIIRHVKQGVASGLIADGDELPSRRVLSTLLGVNPNTVHKAYVLLEEEGLVRSRTGAKSFVAVDAETPERLRAELLESDVRTLVRALRQTGLQRDEALSLVDKYWEEGSAP